MNNIDALREFFGWCSVLNFSMLIFVTIILTAFKETVAKIHSAVMRIDEKVVSNAYFDYLANYKIAIFIFCLAPYVALRIMS